MATPEDKSNSDQILEDVANYLAPTPDMGRQARRRALKQQQKAMSYTMPPTKKLITSAALLEQEDDLPLYRRSLKEYQESKIFLDVDYDFYRFLIRIEAPESGIRDLYAHSDLNRKSESGELTTLLRQAHQGKVASERRYFTMLQARLRAQVRNKFVEDEDTQDIYDILKELEDITVGEVIRESLRARTESIDLIRMQIAWLETDSRGAAPDLPTTPLQVTELPEPEPEPEKENASVVVTKEKKVEFNQENYLLADWNLFWTKNHYSADPNHLLQILTSSREEAVESFEEVSRGEISIKPISIIRALEFHLGKDVIQKALATRNKYGPEGIKDWVKIKRGKDRIFFLVPEEGRAIFFAVGRDVAYRT